MAELYQLQEQEIPEAMGQLQDSHNNLKKVADYCEGFYLQAEASKKKPALDETRSYTTQALASVAYQINTLATSFLSLLDLQARQLVDMESSINHLSQLRVKMASNDRKQFFKTKLIQTVAIHKEKVARREIGVLTTNKSFYRPLGVKSPGIIFPEQAEKPVKYVRKPIDYTILDSVGHGGPKVQISNHRNTRPGSVSSTSSSSHSNVPKHNISNPQSAAGTLTRGRGGIGTIAPPVEPPSVPSHYMSAQQLQQAQQSGAQSNIHIANPTYGQIPAPPPIPNSNPMAANGRNESPYSTAGHHVMYNGGAMMQPPSPISPPLPPMPIADNGYNSNQAYNERLRSRQPSHYRYYVPNMPPPPSEDIPSPPPPPGPDDMGPINSSFPEYPHHMDEYDGDGDSMRNSVPFPPPINSTNSRMDPPWAPENYLEKVVAIFDYTPQNDDELQFRENVILYVIKKNSDGWWEGVMESDDGSPICGLFPENYVESLL